MPDLAQLRQEFSDLHGKATAIIDKAAAEKRDFTPEEKTEVDTFSARMDAIKSVEEQATKLAAYKFSAGEVTKPAEPAGKTEAEQVEGVRGSITVFDAKKPEVRQEFSRAVNDWVKTGVMPQKFATITTATQSGILLPVSVAPPIAASALNPFRQAYDFWKTPVLSTPNTETINMPALTASAGGVVSQTASSDSEGEPGTGESFAIACNNYQSNSSWFSNLQLAAVDFDLLSAYVPLLRYQKELGLEAAIASAMQADTNITQSVSTDSTSSITYPTLVKLNRALPKRYDVLKFMVLNSTAFSYLEGMVDANKRPIMTADPQNEGVLKLFSGTPVFRTDNLQQFGTSGNVIGLVISLMAFRLRDAGGENLIRYVNVPSRPVQTGINLVAAHGWGYSPLAVAKFVNT